MGFLGDDEDLIFSKRDRHIWLREIRMIRRRERLFVQKDIGYSEALAKAKDIQGLLEVFFGYVRGLGISCRGLDVHIARLLKTKRETLKEKIEYILRTKEEDKGTLHKILHPE